MKFVVKSFRDPVAASLRQHEHRRLILIFGVAMAIRLIAVKVELPMHLGPELDHFPFGYETGRVARAIALGYGFSNPFHGATGPTAWVPPVYPYLLAGIFKLFGIYTKVSAIAILFLNSLFSALTCLPIYYVARRGFGQKVALGAAWAWALFPYAIFFPAYFIWDQSLTASLLTLLFLAAVRLEQSSKLCSWIGFGLLSGFAALTNPIVLSVVPFLGGWICYRMHRQEKAYFLPACGAVFMLILSLTPWMARNYMTFHRIVPIRDNFWAELYIGNSGDDSEFCPIWTHPAGNESEWEEYRRAGELGYIAEKHRRAVEFIESHPAWFAIATLRRISFIWTGIAMYRTKLMSDPDEPFNLMNIVTYTSLTVSMLFGMRRAIRERNVAAIPYFLVLFTLPLVYYITHPSLKYRHPIDPEALILAVYAAVPLVSSTFSRVWHPPRQFAARLPSEQEPRPSPSSARPSVIADR